MLGFGAVEKQDVLSALAADQAGVVSVSQGGAVFKSEHLPMVRLAVDVGLIASQSETSLRL